MHSPRVTVSRQHAALGHAHHMGVKALRHIEMDGPERHRIGQGYPKSGVGPHWVPHYLQNAGNYKV